MKRLFDICGALLGLAAIAPFTPFIILAIIWDTPGPAIVKLRRVSQGTTFPLYKFRSMVRDAETLKGTLRHLNERADGPFFKIKHDPRVTRVGRVIRAFRIDEFPQLWNVLRGELSLVGPRPHEPEELASYPPEYRHLSLAKAGVTGLSQVQGASSLHFRTELELDSHYVNHRTLLLDMKILLKTLAILFSDPTAV